MMFERQALLAQMRKVTHAMIHLSGGGKKEQYPIGLIDFNLWEWPQGVGLYGLYRSYRVTNDPQLLKTLCGWFDARIAQGLPEKNVNTMAPMLTLIELWRITGREDYRGLCDQWSAWIMHEMLRTGDGALQHMITGNPNDGQMLIDTLFMTVLFLSRAGKLLDKPAYIEEAKRQFLVHIKYLYDIKSGLFFHGYDFHQKNHYGAIHWGRGNAWYTCGVVEFLDNTHMDGGLKQYLLDTLLAQAGALSALQTPQGLWRTVLDDETSYVETSASAAFAYGILRAVRRGYLPMNLRDMGLKAAQGVLAQIDGTGLVQNVSYGTPVGHNRRFYLDIPVCPMTYGQALTILMLSELLENDDILCPESLQKERSHE